MKCTQILYITKGTLRTAYQIQEQQDVFQWRRVSKKLAHRILHLNEENEARGGKLVFRSFSLFFLQPSQSAEASLRQAGSLFTSRFGNKNTGLSLTPRLTSSTQKRCTVCYAPSLSRTLHLALIYQTVENLDVLVRFTRMQRSRILKRSFTKTDPVKF